MGTPGTARAAAKAGAVGRQAVGEEGLPGWRRLALSSREPPKCRSNLSPLESVETTLRLPATGPQPLALQGHAIGLRRDAIALWELLGLLFHPATGARLQWAALLELVRRGRRHRGAWMIGLVGALLPGCASKVPALSRITRAAWCSSTSSSAWMTPACPTRPPPRHSSERSFDLQPHQPGRPAVGSRPFPAGSDEPLPDRGGGRRGAECLGQLGLQAQGSAGRCPAREAALAVPEPELTTLLAKPPGGSPHLAAQDAGRHGTRPPSPHRGWRLD
jgi:hypothetical protein